MDTPVKKPWADIQSLLWGRLMRGNIQEYQMVGSTYTLGKGETLTLPCWLTTSSTFRSNPTGLSAIGCVKVLMCTRATCSPRTDRVTSTSLMHNRDTYQKFLTAMEVCKMLKLQTRKERVLVCRIVRDGMSAEQADSIAIPGSRHDHHAKLSPSSAYRWLACPGSVREEAKYPEPRAARGR